MSEARQFRVHSIGNTVSVIWVDDGLGRMVSADVRTPGATYARETESGTWRRAPIHQVRRITFTNARMLASLVRKMLTDDTLPKV